MKALKELETTKDAYSRSIYLSLVEKLSADLGLPVPDQELLGKNFRQLQLDMEDK